MQTTSILNHTPESIIKGQGVYKRADTQPPGRAAAACAPATHNEEQRRKKERARASGHNEHSFHGEGTRPSTRQLGYKASAESQPMAGTSSAAAGPTSVTVQEWTRGRPLSMSVRHSIEIEWRGIRAVV